MVSRGPSQGSRVGARFARNYGLRQQGRLGLGLSKPLVITTKRHPSLPEIHFRLIGIHGEGKMIWPKQLNFIFKEIGSGGAAMSRWICRGNLYLICPNLWFPFCIQSTFDILPCLSNLFCWKLSADSLCTLCKTPSATVSHISIGCKVALKQVRYTYLCRVLKFFTDQSL